MADHSPGATVEITVIKIEGTDQKTERELVVVEKALTVYVNDQEFTTMVCSPGQEKELIAGFLSSEGMIQTPDQLVKTSLDQEKGLMWVETTGGSVLGETLFLKRYITSCCGKGKTSFYFANDARLTKEITSALKITSRDVSHYINLLESNSELFHQTGGVHSGAFASHGQLDSYVFDIGRHNVLDKLYGHAFLNGIDLTQKAIVFSGRISSEILIKTGKMGCPILIGVSAPTELAINLAEELGITVIGFARNKRMNVYTHPERILVSDQLSS
ncbi:formate dehydrogenase accessory sulfurtransferase FdhD [Dehalobacterium formicoaceticum]|uniref:Sulfur carrier protein FdhD n=1 Tax=Dehalobacterium formicoaceticum TaxID=51515 RepID=A0ABT1Y7M5_9FIRM|nr:formate dehydrogenase accessory sulfurtransferase FdhD [Dehalobacterium formicoaceticum]MCR6546889.1 formate dehydrogenase accessory sulfurtransferase FdhD [Dehalobacterium formicoaceticum]